VQDSKTGDVILKMVNAGNEAKPMKVDLSTLQRLANQCANRSAQGNADDENSFDNLGKVAPAKSGYTMKSKFDYQAPAMSLTVIRVKTKKKLKIYFIMSKLKFQLKKSTWYC
jgi:alpha-L-arabinofuranosidase